MKSVIAAITVSVFVLMASDTVEQDHTMIGAVPPLLQARSIQLSPSDIATPKGLPPIGKWMHENNGTPAHWLDVKWNGKYLIEPINVILIDKVSKSPDEAKSRLNKNMHAAGFTDRGHHSSGYEGYIGGKFYSQIPAEKYLAISDGAADAPNNHGRIFGPCNYQGAIIFIASFSREVFSPTEKIMHRYDSFARAREAFSRKLDRLSAYKITGKTRLNNMYIDNNEITTGDHDGYAVILSLNR